MTREAQVLQETETEAAEAAPSPGRIITASPTTLAPTLTGTLTGAETHNDSDDDDDDDNDVRQVWEELRVGRGLGVLPALVPRVPRVRGRRGQDRGRRGGRHGGAPLAGGAGQVGGI